MNYNDVFKHKNWHIYPGPDTVWMESVKKITDPIEMLAAIIHNEKFLGYDRYYVDLRECLLDQAEKIVAEGISAESLEALAQRGDQE